MSPQKNKSISSKESDLAVTIQQSDFLYRLKEYKEKLSSLGLSFPNDGMRPAQFHDWVKRYNEKAGELSLGADFSEYKRNLLKGSKTMSHDQFIQIETYRADHLLPLDWFQFLADAMISIGLNPDDKQEKDFVTGFFFFSKKRILRNVWNHRIQKNKETGKLELFIEIFPYTTQQLAIQNADRWKLDKVEVTKDDSYKPKYKRQLSFLKTGERLFVKVEKHVTTNFLIKNWFKIEEEKRGFFGVKRRERRSEKLELVAEKIVGTVRKNKTQKEIILEKLQPKKGRKDESSKKPSQKSPRLAKNIGTTSEAIRRSKYKIKKTQISSKKKFMR